MPWYVSTLETFAVTHVRPAPPERVDARRSSRADREKSRSEAVLREVEALGFSAVFMTVDGPVIDAADERDVVMVLSGVRHFRH